MIRYIQNCTMEQVIKHAWGLCSLYSDETESWTLTIIRITSRGQLKLYKLDHEQENVSRRKTASKQ